MKKLRCVSKYTQKQIVDYLEIDQGNLSKIENGNRKLNLSLLDKLCSLYNCSHEYILLQSDEHTFAKIAFRINENFVDLNLVSKMNQIMDNLKFLKSLDER